MAEKGKTRKFVFITICIVLILILLAGYVQNIFEKGDKNVYIYTVEINPEENGNFSLYVPIAFNYNNEKAILDVIDHLIIIEGQGNYSLKNTLYGIALKIDGNGYISLKSEETNGDEYFSLYLSIYKREVSKRTLGHWIYCDSEIENISVNIKLSNEHGESRSGYSEETYPEIQVIHNIGWQEIITETDEWGI